MEKDCYKEIIAEVSKKLAQKIINHKHGGYAVQKKHPFS
jgi:hypothetical protein